MRFTLRPYAPSDRDAFLALFGDPEVVRWVGDGQVDSERNRRMFEKLKVLEIGSEQRFAFVLAVCQGDALIGHVELKQTDETGPDEWELVYIFARRVWGRGYGTELATWALQTAHAHDRRLVATVDPENAASLHILARCGLQERGRLPDGTLVLGERG